jgi:hypothetical protein
MSHYRTARFYVSTFAKPSGRMIWSILNHERTIGEMVAASRYNRPAVEPISLRLLASLPEESRDDLMDHRCRRMIGHMVKQVMESKGYQLDRWDVPISDNVLFTRGACYKRSNSGRAGLAS